MLWGCVCVVVVRVFWLYKVDLRVMHYECSITINAAQKALLLMGPELVRAHVETALRYGGYVVWQPEVVAIVVPWKDGHPNYYGDVLAVLYAGGDVVRLAELAEGWVLAGYRQFLMCRGFRGDGRCRVWDMERFAHLVKVMKG